MNELQIFNSSEFGEIRTVTIDNEIWFVGADVAKALGYSNPRKAILDHCKGVTKRDTPTSSGIQSISYINEGDMYRLIIRSKLPSAEKFEDWVVNEVLPSIRKNGGYISGQETLSDDELLEKAVLVAQKKIAERDRIIAQQQEKIEQDKPKTIFADAVSATDTSILVRDMAKMIRQNGVPMGEKRFYRWLRDNGYICQRSTMPTQKAMELGLFEIVVRTIERGDKLPLETKTARITGKGQIYFANKFLGNED